MRNLLLDRTPDDFWQATDEIDIQVVDSEAVSPARTPWEFAVVPNAAPMMVTQMEPVA